MVDGKYIMILEPDDIHPTLNGSKNDLIHRIPYIISRKMLKKNLVIFVDENGNTTFVKNRYEPIV